MKKILLLLFFVFPAGMVANAQIKLPKDFTCYYSEKGYGLTNGNFSFYKEDISSDLTDKELLDAYLSDYTKTKDGLFTKSGKNEEYFYEIIIPSTFTRITLSAKKDKSRFEKYSTELLSAVRKNAGSKKDFFIKSDGYPCPSKK